MITFLPHWGLEEKLMVVADAYCEIEEAFLNGDERYISEWISWLESEHPRMRLAASLPIGYALLAKQQVLTESVFLKKTR